MTSPHQSNSEAFRRLISEIRQAVNARLRWRGLFITVSVCTGCVLAGAIAAPLFPVTGAVRWLYWTVLAAAAGASYWWSALRATRRYRSDEQVAFLIQREVPELADTPINAVQLQQELDRGTQFSRGLLEAYLQEAAERARNARARAGAGRVCLAWPACAAAGSLLLLMVVLSVAPGRFARGLQVLLSGSGATATGPHGSARLQVLDLSVTYHYPEYASLPARTVEGSDVALDAVRGTTAVLTGRFAPAVSAACLIVNGGLRAEATIGDGNAFRVTLPLLDEGRCHFEGSSRGGRQIVSDELAIRLDRDNAPAASITRLVPEPGTDGVVEADEGGMVEVAYECHDDYGVGEVVLRYELDGQAREQTIARPRPAARSLRGAYGWALPALSPSSEGVLTFRVGAKDNDNISGPKTGLSRPVTVRLVSDQVRHARLLGEQEKLLRLMVRLLADELTALPGTGTPAAAEAQAAVQEITGAVRDVVDLNREIVSAMESDPMADETFCDALREMLARRSAAHGALAALTGAIGAQREPPGGPAVNWDEARRVIADGIEPLENDILRLDDLLALDHIRAARSLADQLAQIHKELEDLLRQCKEGGLSPEQLEDLRRRITAMARMLDKLELQLAESARRVEREFLNPDALNLADWREQARDALNRLLSKAQADDLQGALAEAASLREQIARMMEGLQTTGHRLASARLGGQYEALQRLREGLGEIRDEQEALRRATQSLADDIRKAALAGQGLGLDAFLKVQTERADRVAAQVDALARELASQDDLTEYRRLREELRERIAAIEDISRHVQGGSPGGAAKSRQELLAEAERERDRLDAVCRRLARMDKAAAADQVLGHVPTALARAAKLSDQLKGADLQGGLASATSLAGILKATSQTLDDAGYPGPAPAQAAAAAQTSQQIRADLAELLQQLERACRQAAAGPQGAQADSLAGRQSDTAQRLQALARNGGQGAGPALQALIKEAELDMNGAGAHLSGRRLAQSSQRQQAALDKLDQAIARAGDLARQLSQNMQGMAAAVPGRRTPPAGRTGHGTDQVPIPDPSAYQVPKAFREEIQEALKHGLPRAYQDTNEGYYDELVK